MKQLSTKKKITSTPLPMSLIIALCTLSLWITFCCAALLEWDQRGNLLAHSYSIWGDWSAHFTFISNILERGIHWITGDNPVFSGMPFQYPFLSHLTTALFAWIFHCSPITATYGLSLFLITLLPTGLFRFYRALGLKPWTSFAALCLFLFAGGLQFLDSSLSTTEALTNQFSQGSLFTQFIEFEFFPQRAFLFGLICLTFLGTQLVKKITAKTLTKKSAFLFCLGFALTPLLHMHTWIAIATLTFSVFLIQRKKSIFQFGLLLAAISSVGIAFLLFRGNTAEYSLGWNAWMPGWAQNKNAGQSTAQEMNLIWFWIYNTGLFLPLALFGSYFAFKPDRTKKNDEEIDWLRPLALAGVLCFLVAELFQLQPYFYDNLKLFTYAWFFLAPLAALALEKIALKKVLIPVAALLLFLQCFTALSDLNFMRKQTITATLLDAQDFEMAQEFKKFRSSADALVLITPRHNHWVSCLAGNPVVMGFPGWLWSWGINYSNRERQVHDILLGHPNAMEEVTRLHPDYIVVKNDELVENVLINHGFLRSHFQLLFEKNGWEIYSTKSPSSSVR